jgi:hypothetical protein
VRVDGGSETIRPSMWANRKNPRTACLEVLSKKPISRDSPRCRMQCSMWTRSHRIPVLLWHAFLDAAPATPNANIAIRVLGFVVTRLYAKPVFRARTADICRPMYAT